MITRNDWLAAADAFMDEERARLGGPPTDEERAAYARGELSEEETERVRALIVYYDDGTLTDEEKAEDWAAIEAGIAAQRTPAPWRWWLSIAAAVAVAFLAGWFSQSQLKRDDEPRVHASRYTLESQRTRGGGPPVADLPAEEETFLLEVTLGDAPAFPRYRVDVVAVESTPARTIWSTEVELRSGNAFEISLSRAFLEPGLYRIDVSGLNGAKRKALESYLIRVPPRG